MKRIVISLFSLCLLVVFAAGCGKVVEQDKIVLQFSTLGERSVTVRNDQDTSDATLLTATRLPVVKTGRTFLIFPRGNQSYMFSKRPSVESPKNEEFCIAAVDGKVCFDVAVHTHLATELPDIKERLIAFAQTYSLARYTNSNNVLGAFVSDQLRPVLQSGYTSYGASKKVLTLMRTKSEVNEWMVEYMNNKFEPFALKFTLAHIFSAMRPGTDLQERMNQIVISEVTNRVASFRTTEIEPLKQKEADFNNEGKEGAARIVSQAHAEAIVSRDKAQRAYRTAIIKQIGKDLFAEFEQARLLQEAFEGGKMQLEIVPSGSIIVLGEQAVVPTSKSTK